MSSHVIVSFQAKPDEVQNLIQLLAGLQDHSIQAGAITASLMQDENDRARLIEEEVWESVEEHQHFINDVIASPALREIEALLAAPFEVKYLDTVKYSRSRRH